MRYRYILRGLRRAPGFTVIAALTLALGIGANTAIFSVIEGVLLKPLPYPHPDELVGLWHTAKGINLPEVNMAPFLYFIYREQNHTMVDVGAWDTGSSSVTGMAEPEQVPLVEVTEGTLPLLGVQPEIGRWFSSKDASPGAPETVMLMYGYWQSRLGGERSVVGRKIVLDGRPREIIGVMPQRFQFLDYKPSLIVPYQFDRAKTYLGSFNFQGLARLKPGVTLAQANADVARMIPMALGSFPPFPGFNKQMFEDARLTPALRPLKRDVTGTIGNTLWLLMGTIGMVLLIACANVANLLLVRAGGREQELAIRGALGAGWKAIAWELIAESLTLGVVGGVAGLGLAAAGLRLLVAAGPANLPRLSEIGIDGWALLFTLGVSLLAGLLFAAVPVFKYAGSNLAGALHGGGRTLSHSRDRQHARSVLVVVQVALALVLLVGSGLMIRSFTALRNVQPGFTRPERIQTLRLSIPGAQVKDDLAAVRMEKEILDKLAAIPGVEAVGVSSTLPLNESGWHDPVYAENHAYAEGKLPPLRRYRFVSPGVLKATGTRLVAGRDFAWNEVFDKRPLAMVSENLAREFWGTPQAAVGKRLRESPHTPWHEVVGVVENEYEDGLDQKPPSTVFWPILIDNFAGDKVFVWRSLFYVIRSGRTGTEGFLPEIQRAVWSVNPNLPLATVRTMQAVYDKSIARVSFTVVMLGIAGAMALLLGMVGIYGVISYTAAQRTREVGIRMALGAQRGELTRLFLSHGLRLALIGVACGLAASVGLTQLMAKLLFAVKPVDPLTYGTVAVCLTAAAVAASVVPALRITAIDPVEALRAE